MDLPNENAPLPSAFGNGPIWISTGRMSVALRPSFRENVVGEAISIRKRDKKVHVVEAAERS